MTTRKNDGGPAFPRPASEYEPNGIRHDGRIAALPHNGMTLRDYFAASALQGFLAGRNINALDCSFYTCEKAARNCYGYADAMLAARKEGA